MKVILSLNKSVSYEIITYLKKHAGQDKCHELWLIVVHITGEFVLDVEASTGSIFCTPE